jgi:hypothetical protein
MKADEDGEMSEERREPVLKEVQVDYDKYLKLY